MNLHANRPEPLFASLTIAERALLGVAALWVSLGTPYILFTLWSTVQ